MKMVKRELSITTAEKKLTTVGNLSVVDCPRVRAGMDKRASPSTKSMMDTIFKDGAVKS